MKEKTDAQGRFLKKETSGVRISNHIHIKKIYTYF